MRIELDGDTEMLLRADMVKLRHRLPNLSYARLMNELIYIHYREGRTTWLHG